jgi:hypothetical protein
VEGWKIGRWDGWKVGRLEGWKVGRLEGWKVGRLFHNKSVWLSVKNKFYDFTFQIKWKIHGEIFSTCHIWPFNSELDEK